MATIPPLWTENDRRRSRAATIIAHPAQLFTVIALSTSGEHPLLGRLLVASELRQRSAGHGVWERTSRQVYDLRLISLVLFETAPNLPGLPGFDPALPVGPGFFKGWDTVAQTVRFTDADHFTSTGTSAFFKEDGTRYRDGCSTAVGQRVF